MRDYWCIMFRHTFRNVLRARSSGYRRPLAGAKAVLGLGLSAGILSLHRHAFFNIQPNDDSSNDSDSDFLTSGQQHITHSGPATRTFSQSRYGGIANSSSTESVYSIGSTIIHEESHTPGYGGIARFDVVKVSSSDLDQGDVSSAILPTPNGSWSFFAVMEGSGGRETSRWLSENLIIALAGSLADLYAQFDPSDPAPSRAVSSSVIEDALKSTFLRLDNDIVNERAEEVLRHNPPRRVGIEYLAPSLSGAHALLVFYDEQTRLMISGLTGTLRAVLGRRATDDKPRTVPVLGSNNHTAKIPGNFGDARKKWSNDTQNQLAAAGYIDSVSSPKSRTTAEPEIVSLHVHKGDFLILGSAALWQRLSDEEAIDVVEKWLNEQSTIRRQDKLQNHPEPTSIADLWEQLATREPFKEHDFGRLFNNPGNFNVATHLYKNAFGADKFGIAAQSPTETAKETTSESDMATIVVVFFE